MTTFVKTHDVDKDRFAKLLCLARGPRTMKDFAIDCNTNPATFSRILNKLNKGASSPELLIVIAENAAAESDITLEALADANGYTIKEGYKPTRFKTNTSNRSVENNPDLCTIEKIDTSVTEVTSAKQNKMLSRAILLNHLLENYNSVTFENRSFSVGKFEIKPDIFVKTTSCDNITDNLIVDFYGNDICNLAKLVINRLSLYYYVSITNNEDFRYVIIAPNAFVYAKIKELFNSFTLLLPTSLFHIDCAANQVIETCVLGKEVEE